MIPDASAAVVTDQTTKEQEARYRCIVLALDCARIEGFPDAEKMIERAKAFYGYIVGSAQPEAQ